MAESPNVDRDAAADLANREVASPAVTAGPSSVRAERALGISGPAQVRSDTISASEWPEAIRRLVGGDARTAHRVLQRIEHGSLAIEAMEATRNPEGGFTAVAIAVRNPGRTLGLVLSPLQVPNHRPAATAAVSHLLGSLRGSDAALIQAMFDPGRRAEIAATVDSGFRHLARLRFMDGDLPRLVREELPIPPNASIEPCGRSDPDELAMLLSRTYDRTLDCPGLAGLRRTEDVLAGHRASGQFDPDLWFMLRVDGRPAGLSLLNPNAEAGCTELVYFGLVPEARGRGLAKMLLRHCLARIDERAPSRIALAVDDRNSPALRLYRRHGFVPGGLRTALVRPLR
jgi:ribosomal protein S18 acetylase RimI-like enzyme